ncbi:MAG: hypothetical protein OXK20_10620 [Deltaproteobacteria bacterium]|nr:hypothetical protein [Deltaproteobacteria bacterium]
MAFQILHKQGHRNMKVLYEGMPGWTEKGYPMDSNATESSS